MIVKSVHFMQDDTVSTEMIRNYFDMIHAVKCTMCEMIDDTDKNI